MLALLALSARPSLPSRPLSLRLPRVVCQDVADSPELAGEEAVDKGLTGDLLRRAIPCIPARAVCRC